VRTWSDVDRILDLELGGVLGHNILRRYRVTFDLKRQVLGLRVPGTD
jgi:hypothetical protein